MRTTLILILLFISACGDRNLPVKKLDLTDGLQYNYFLFPKLDSLRVFNTGEDTFAVFMRFEKISRGFPLPDVITEIDNALTEESAYQLAYTPNTFAGDNIISPNSWNFSRNQIFNVAHYKNTLAFLQKDGWVEYTFTGYKIEYWAEQFESYGIAGVSIDKGAETMVDLYAPEDMNNSRLVFTSDSLSNSQHVIRVRYTAQRNPKANSSNARINLDKFTVYFSQGNFYPPTFPTPAKMQYEQPKSSNE